MSRREIRVLAFTATYLAVATPYAWRTGNHEFVFYILVMLLLAGLVWTVHRRVVLHAATLWGLSLWGLAHMAGGLLRVDDAGTVLYSAWLVEDRLRYDQVVHAAGFGLSTWVCWQGLARGLADPRPTAGGVFLAALCGMGLGALNEVVEFVATLTVPETNVGGYVNTGWDLVSNAVGAAVAAVWIYVVGRRRTSGSAVGGGVPE